MEGKRPTGLSTISIILGWLALSGEFIFWMSKSETISILALLYGASALAAGIGIWNTRPWAFKVYLAWCSTVVFMLISVQLGSVYRTDILVFMAFAIFVIALLSFTGLYINKKLKILIEPGHSVERKDRAPH
jgi:hypothetical protein